MVKCKSQMYYNHINLQELMCMELQHKYKETYFNKKALSRVCSNDFAIESLIHSRKLFTQSIVLVATFVRKQIGKLRCCCAQYCTCTTINFRNLSIQKRGNIKFKRLTCSKIKISSNALPAVSTGRSTFPSAFRAFSIASEEKEIFTSTIHLSISSDYIVKNSKGHRQHEVQKYRRTTIFHY